MEPTPPTITPTRDVLVVAYYFPPMGLSGVQRVAKFVKYLPEHGWRPTVLTVEPGGYFAYDESLLDEMRAARIEVHRTRSLDPTRLFGSKSVVRLPAEPARQRLSLLSQWIFIPDNKLGWMPTALRAGKSLLSSGRFSAILSSAPPYTGHLIARRLAQTSGLPLILDFRDDWVGNPRHVYPAALHRIIHEHLERRVLAASAQTITINECIAASLESRMPAQARNPRVEVLPQGYDQGDFTVLPAERRPGVMQIVHAGIFYDRQTPDTFLKALAGLIQRRPDATGRLEAVFVGLFPEASRQLVQDLGLGEHVRLTGYVPHREVPSYLLSADLLWMTIGKRPGAECISTGKLFEYFGSRKPVLALIPDGTAARALQTYEAARIVDPDDVQGAAAGLESFFDEWKDGRLPLPPEEAVIQYDRRRLAGELARILSLASDAPSSFTPAP